MNVLLQGRADLFDKPGGDLVQMQQTQKALQNLGLKVEISNEMTPNLDGFDLIHLFNITRIHETYYQLLNAKKQTKKVVISPIHHKLADIERYELMGRTGNLKHINVILPSISLREQAKLIVRLKDHRQRPAILSTLKKGFVNSQKYALQHADAWIVLANLEAKQITKDFDVENRAFVAHNAVDKQFFNAAPDQFVQTFKLHNFILCVSRIEDRKNQIGLIEACRGLGKKLVFIGAINKYHGAYASEFMRLVERERKWVSYLGPIPYQNLPSAYAAASLHVLPSWFEVVSLTALEAAATGCPGVVADNGYIREYLENAVAYCDPGNIQSMREGIEQQLSVKNISMPRIQTWEDTGRETMAAYKKVLNYA